MTKFSRLITVLLLAGIPLVHAANFQLYEQSATLLGQADAGTAVADDPSVQYYNPAATAFFKHTTVGISSVYIMPDITFHHATATNYQEQTITGSTASPRQNALIPAGYFIQPIDDKLVLGFGITVPFGLSTNYGRDSIARYMATSSKIETFNLNPSFAYRFTDWFAIGFGLDGQYMKATLNQAVDFHSLYQQAAGDVQVDNTASDWGYGWNGGVYIKPTATLKIGLSYRSQIRHHLTGNSQVKGAEADPFIAGYYGLVDSNVSSNITLPAYTTLSLQQDINSRWSVMADAEFINWSVVQQLALRFSSKSDSPAARTPATVVIPLHYHNTWRLSLGQSYQITPSLIGRMGVAYDQSPMKRRYTIARLPDTDRYWLTLGLTYHNTARSTVNIGYAHLFFKPTSVSQQLDTGMGTEATYSANYDASANIIGIQYNYKWN